MTYPTVELTASQARMWSETRAAFMWICPAFSHILVKLMNKGKDNNIAIFTHAVPTAATDGSTLIINPDWFLKLGLMERVFVTAHEVLHCILNHCGSLPQFLRDKSVKFPDGKSLPYDHQTMNMAMDLIVNSTLVASDVGKMPDEGVYDPKIADHTVSFIEAYRRVFKTQPPGGGGGQGKGPSGGFDQHLQPGSVSGDDERDEQEWRQEVAAAAQAAKAMGKLPGALERLLDEVINPGIDWREHIRGLFARRLGTGSYDWCRPDRRQAIYDWFMPASSGFGAEHVVVGADTSGSITDPTVAMFFGAVAEMLDDVRPRRLTIIWCDAKVRRVDELGSAAELGSIIKKGAPGGGGTAFEPVFAYIEDQGWEPDALVYLTDGYGSFPKHAPRYPVIWGDIAGTEYPFGDVVRVPAQAE